MFSSSPCRDSKQQHTKAILHMHQRTYHVQYCSPMASHKRQRRRTFLPNCQDRLQGRHQVMTHPYCSHRCSSGSAFHQSKDLWHICRKHIQHPLWYPATRQYNWVLPMWWESHLLHASINWRLWNPSLHAWAGIPSTSCLSLLHIPESWLIGVWLAYPWGQAFFHPSRALTYHHLWSWRSPSRNDVERKFDRTPRREWSWLSKLSVKCQKYRVRTPSSRC